jgi:cytochrome b561
MEAPNWQRTLPAFAAIGIITIFVLLSISGYLVLSAS